MVNSGHRVRVRMTAKIDDGTELDLGLGEGGEAVFTMGAGEFSAYAESFVAGMSVGQTAAWKTPAVRVLGPKAVGRDVRYELTLLDDLGREVMAVAEEHARHEHGCSCGCDRLRQSLAHA
ncbi:MAG: FKBP-type peptidyl-prolyl cis-trans isomerase [Eggerthellaceae bacterium]|nr:FKBP-type peptidyl-prolyl cis-trans isomerase [Eggerthellaceae bacterium]